MLTPHNFSAYLVFTSSMDEPKLNQTICNLEQENAELKVTQSFII